MCAYTSHIRKQGRSLINSLQKAILKLLVIFMSHVELIIDLALVRHTFDQISSFIMTNGPAEYEKSIKKSIRVYEFLQRVS